MDLKNCGRKFAVITSQRHRDGGFEAALPDGTMWVVDEESNPDVRKKLLEAMRRNVDIAIIDEAGSAHPDVLYPDVCAFKQDLKDSKRTMQVMVIASTDHFTEDDPYMGQLLACGVYDVIGTDDKRNVGEAIADMMAAPSTLEEVEARIGASAPKGALAKAGAWFGRKDRKAKKKEKEKAKKGRKEEKAAEEQAPMEPKTLADSLSSEDAAEGGMKPLTTAPSETAMAMRMLEDSGKLPRLGEDGEPAVEPREDPVEEAAARIRAVGARVEPQTTAKIGTRDESQGAEEPGTRDESQGAGESRTQNESQGADERWTQNESRAAAASARVGADPVPAAAQAIERGAGSPAPDAAMVPADLAMRLEAMMSARLEEEMARREEEMREKYDRMLGDALRQGRAQRTVAVFSAVPAMTAEAALEAVAYVKRALPKANALMVEHDASRLPFLEPYGAAAPGDGDAAPDVVVRDFGCDAAAAMACRAEVRLFVCSPTPWSVEDQAEAWNALEGRDGLHCCIPARGPRASAIAEALTGSKEHLCLPDPSHFAAKPVFVPRDFEAAMGGIVESVAKEMGVEPKPAFPEPKKRGRGEERPDGAAKPASAAPKAPEKREEAGSPKEKEPAAAPSEANEAPKNPAQREAKAGSADGGAPERDTQAPAVSWVNRETFEADGPHLLAGRPEGWLEGRRAERPEGEWAEVGPYEPRSSDLSHWKGIAMVEIETRQKQEKLRRDAEKARRKAASTSAGMAV